MAARTGRVQLADRVIAGVLGRVPGWSATATAAEPDRAAAGEPAAAPGVVVDTGRGRAVVLAAFRPAAAALRKGVEAAGGLDIGGLGATPACAVGIVLPDELAACREPDIERTLSGHGGIEYCVGTGGGRIFPAHGYLEGTLGDVGAAIRLASAPRGLISEGYALAVDGMQRIVDIFRDAAGGRAQGAICAELGQGPGEYTWRMAALVLLNAATFYEDAAGRLDGMPPLAALSAAGAAAPERLLDAWDRAGAAGHAPILGSAAGILRPLPGPAAARVVEVLADASPRLAATGAHGFGDFYGMLYQRQLHDRKRAAAFYTRPEAATLLAELVMRGPGDAAWHDEGLLKNLRIADMACGSGSLLHAAYTHIANCSSLDLPAIHRDVMRDCLWGFDIFPVAAHFAVSSLASLFPGRAFDRCRIYARRIGADADGCRLGSLDLMEDDAPPGAHPEGGDSVRHASCDYILMNPPFVRSTDHGEHRKDPVPQYAVFGIAPEAQRAMARRDKKLFRGTCAHGNAGLGTYFLAICHRKIKPGGRFGMILPDTALSGESWSKARRMVSLWYDDITVVSVGHGRDGTYSADTDMHEIMLVGRRRGSMRAAGDGRPRVKFVQLDRMPCSKLEAFAVAKCIKGADAADLGGAAGRTTLRIGGDPVGRAVGCPIDGGRWWCRRAASASMLEFAYALAHSLPLAAGGPRPSRSTGRSTLRVTDLGRVARMGRLHRDIADGNPGGGRAPFMRMPYSPGSKFPCLWANDAKSQDSMVVAPDTSLEAKPAASREAVGAAWATRTRLHLNNNVGYGAQKLIAAYTEEPTLGGRGWPNVMIDERFEKAMAVWCNSSLGLISYWSVSGSQQRGRGIMGVSAFRSLPVLDVASLSGRQLSLLDGLFDRLCRRALRPLSSLRNDHARRDLDASMLGILEMDGVDLDRVYGWIEDDPQFSSPSDGG